MDGLSLTPKEIKLKQLQELMPEVFSEGKVDFERLKATLGEDINFSNERYVLNWAGKSDAFRSLQTPSTKTLIPVKDESVDFDTTENIFIEGENLEVLKVLQKSYFGKIKMIYIDPPYNTGNDSFIYPDKFSETKDEYQKRVGDKDEDGFMTRSSIKSPSFGGVVDRPGWFKNSKENGQYHSNWLNMMYPRLFLAKNLLRQDGVIFVSIDDNEVHNLRLMMNEIFGEENFVGQILWKKKTNGNNMGLIPPVHDFVLVYSKNINCIDSENFGFPVSQDYIEKNYSNPDNHPHGAWTTMDLSANHKGPNFPITNPDSGEIFFPSKGRYWVFNEIEVQKRIKDGRIIFGKSGNSRPVQRVFLKDKELKRFKAESWWDKHGLNADGTKELNELFEVAKIFDHSKPSNFLENILNISTLSSRDEIVLDFFAGTASFSQAVMNLNKEDGGNRKYICVQLPELTEEKSEAFKAGYKTIAEIAKERIRRASKKIIEEIQTEIANRQSEIKNLQSQLPTDEVKAEIENYQSKIKNFQSQDLGFKVLKLSDSNFKQWRQIEGKDLSDRQAGAKALEEQMKLFVDPVSEDATIENMVYELLLKSGKDLNAKIFPSFGGVAESRGGRNSRNYFNLPYNSNLKERARELRQAGNLSEVLFWNQVKKKQFKGYDFDRQKIIGNYIVDFYCSNCNVVVEIDGSSHDDKQEYDADRDTFLHSLGLTVIHIKVADVMNNMSGVMEMLYNHPALKGAPPTEGNLKPNYFVINNGEMALMLEKATREIVTAVLNEKPRKVIALDRLFKGNDQLKTNTALQMKDAGIEFKTI